DPRTGKVTTWNNTFTADGTRQLDGFLVQFDRPIDPNTFTPADVRVIFRDPNTPAGSPGTPVTVTSVTPLDDGTLFGPTKVGDKADDPSVRVLATAFLVRFAAQAGAGTYSYTVGPDITDRIRTTTGPFTATQTPPSQTFPSTDTPRAINDQ